MTRFSQGTMMSSHLRPPRGCTRFMTLMELLLVLLVLLLPCESSLLGVSVLLL